MKRSTVAHRRAVAASLGCALLLSPALASAEFVLEEATVAKVLKILAQAELVMSTRGAAGGYSLSRPAAQISLASIITAMDGPIAIVSCIDSSVEDCRVQATCPVKGKWGRVNEAIKVTLEGVMLTEMVETHVCR